MSGEQLLYNRPTFPAQLDMSHPLTKGLVGCWVLNEEGGMRAFDSSPYKNHGLVTGARGNYQGRTFDGIDDVIIVAGNVVFKSSPSALSGIIWYNPSSTPVSTRTIFSIADAGNGNSGWALNVNQDDAGIATAGWVTIWRHTTAGGWTGAGVAGALNVSIPTCFAFTYDANNLILYKNGVSVRTVAATGNIDFPVGNPAIGIGATEVPGSWSPGIIGEVYLYNRVLVPAEIQQNYLNPYDMFLR